VDDRRWLSVATTKIEHMFDRLAEAQRLLREEFEDSSRPGGAVSLSDAELAGRGEAAQRVANMAQAVQVQRVA
jgi:hypothetical protein